MIILPDLFQNIFIRLAHDIVILIMDQPKVVLTACKNLQVNTSLSSNYHLSFQKQSLNVVLLDISSSDKEKKWMKACEEWLREQSIVQLWKINKSEAFYPIYLDLIKQMAPIYFLSTSTMEELSD